MARSSDAGDPCSRRSLSRRLRRIYETAATEIPSGAATGAAGPRSTRAPTATALPPIVLMAVIIFGVLAARREEAQDAGWYRSTPMQAARGAARKYHHQLTRAQQSAWAGLRVLQSGSCVAVGPYTDSSGTPESMIASQ